MTYPDVLSEFVVSPRGVGWKVLVTFHAIIIPDAKMILGSGHEYGAGIVLCTLLTKGADGIIDKTAGFSICRDGDKWSAVVGMRIALEHVLSQYDHDSDDWEFFVKHVWKRFVKKVVMARKHTAKEAQLVE